jgi:TRAP-type mannitol/chloroaromatic compound transport system substrate-binding protein
MSTVRHWFPAIVVVVLAVTTGRFAMAEPPISSGRTLQMQTAFNPNLPGAGEGVRTFTKSIKQMSGGSLVIKMIEPGRVVPTPEMLDAVISGDLEAAYTWSGYAASKSAVFQLFGTVPFGPGPEDLASWVLDGDGGRIHREAYEKLGVVGLPCGIQGAKGGGWFRSDLNTVADLKGARLRFGKLSGEVLTRLGGTQVPMPSGEFFYQLQQGKIDGGEMATPAIDAALGFDKLGLPYYMPGWHQPSSLLDFLMRKDHWEALSAVDRAQIETACRANMAWMLGRSSHLQAVALDNLRKAGVVIKPWSPALLEAFQRESQVVLKELADQDPEFAVAWANLQEFTAQSTAWHFLSKLP